MYKLRRNLTTSRKSKLSLFDMSRCWTMFAPICHKLPVVFPLTSNTNSTELTLEKAFGTYIQFNQKLTYFDDFLEYIIFSSVDRIIKPVKQLTFIVVGKSSRLPSDICGLSQPPSSCSCITLLKDAGRSRESS